MKPRNKKEAMAVEAYNALPPLTQNEIDWALYEAEKYNIHANKTSSWCECCGSFFQTLENAKKRTCPVCGKTCNVINSRKSSFRHSYYVAFLTVFKGYQVVRDIQVVKRFKRGENEFICSCSEVQTVLFKGKEKHSFRLIYNTFGYGLNWSLNSGVSLRQDYMRIDDYIYPKYKITPELKRNGFTLKAHIGCTVSLVYRLLQEPKFETLVKAGYYNLLKRDKFPMAYYNWNTIKIVLRNKYKVQDWDMYFDYIENLEKLDKDLLNAKYVCPKNLKKAHDDAMMMVRKIAEKEEKIRKQAIAIQNREDEKNYISWFSPYFDMRITNGKINIYVLKTLEEIRDEGKAMHHCIFENRYYRKKTSLLMTARDEKGNRIETIEFDLETMKVLQSRGKCNRHTPQHVTIIELINQNINTIKRIKYENQN